MKISRILMLIAALTLFISIAAAQEDTGARLSTSLSGSAEVPGPGDPDGNGRAMIRLNQGQNQVCFELTVANIAPATVAHIHRGAEGAAGPAVVTLTAPTDGASSGCVDMVGAELIKEIRQNPHNFYVNVHNAEFPDGAVRGQLGRNPK